MACSGQDFSRDQVAFPYLFQRAALFAFYLTLWKLTRWWIATSVSHSTIYKVLQLTVRDIGPSFPTKMMRRQKLFAAQMGNLIEHGLYISFPRGHPVAKTCAHLEVVRQDSHFAAPIDYSCCSWLHKALGVVFHSVFSHACYEIRNTFILLAFDT